MTALQEAYDMIDRVLRNTLYDDDYAEHSAALDLLSSSALAQHGEQAKPAAYITDTEQGPMVWTPEMYDEACTYCDDGEFPVPLYTAAPAAQAQPVAQPLTNSCHTCDHYQQGKRPGVSIHGETCYVCSEYYANKWEAKSD